jgi:selenide,water dikinase
LTQVLRHLVPFHDPAVLVDSTTSDDAAVYRIDADRALVATVDFFTPIVDDPYDFGRIAAANALSDIYAMGARPLFALNLVSFPRKLLGEGVLREIVRGGGEVARLAGVAVLGGHSIDDPEPKFGMCVVGEVNPERVVRNSTAEPGDVLVLTKPIGTGVIATAIKQGALAQGESEQGGSEQGVVAAAVASMTTLNRGAAEAMLRAGAHAATDITSYGLLGHLHELARASGLAARVDAAAVPLLPGAFDLAARGLVPGGTRRNESDLAEWVHWEAEVDAPLRTLLYDAQTSGGLLIAIARERLPNLLTALAEAHTPTATIIGTLEGGPPGTITIAP